MALQTRIADFITAVGTDYKQIRTWITGSSTGSLTSLTTTDKSSLVAAINEAFASGGGTGSTNLSTTRTATSVTINSDTGADAAIPAADATNAGVMSSASVTKLSGIADGADVTSAATVGTAVNSATAKSAPVAGDLLPLVDTEASNVLKKMTVQNLASFVTAIIVNGSPATLDTLSELAAALGNDPNFATTVTNSIAQKQPLDADLTAIAALASAANKMPYSTGAQTWALADLTAAGRAILAAVDSAAQRTTLDVYSKAEIGNPETDLVALYTAAKA